MSLRNTEQSFGSVAKFFHWSIALFIIGLLIAGLTMVNMPTTPSKFKIYGLHKSFGIMVLILAVLRLGWKANNIAPLLPQTLNFIEKTLAHVGHGFLYFLMFAMPLSGWLMSSASGFTVSVFGWFTLPNLIGPDAALKRTFVNIHETLAWILIAMITLHVLAALLHHFYYKNGVLRRMLPWVK